jgi:hypothetical protein
MSRLDEIRARLAAATPSEWSSNDGFVVRMSSREGNAYFEVGTRADASLIAHAPDDLAHLLAEVERLTGERDEARNVATEYAEHIVVLTYQRDEVRAEAAAERAALLAYLRVDPYLHSRCDAIERGEHRLKN